MTKHPRVVLHNPLFLQGHSPIGHQAQRVLWLALTQTHAIGARTQQLTLEVTNAQYTRAYGRPLKPYEWRTVARDLLSLKYFQTRTGDPNNKDDREDYGYNALATWRREYLTDVSRIKFTEEMSRHLTGLTRDYTQMDFMNAAQFKHSASFDLYAIALRVAEEKARGGLGYEVIPIKALRDRLGIGTKYKSFADLRTRVIEPSLAEVRDYGRVNVTLEYDKSSHGRVVDVLIHASLPQKPAKLQNGGEGTVHGDQFDASPPRSASIHAINQTGYKPRPHDEVSKPAVRQALNPPPPRVEKPDPEHTAKRAALKREWASAEEQEATAERQRNRYAKPEAALKPNTPDEDAELEKRKAEAQAKLEAYQRDNPEETS